MKTAENTFQLLMEKEHSYLIHKELGIYSVCIPSLGILVSAKTLDECYVKVEESKRSFFLGIIEHGFGESMLSTRLPSSNPRPWVRMTFTLSVLLLILLTVLIPTNYLLAKLEYQAPAYIEAAMGIVQQRVHQWSDDDQRKLAGIGMRMCPIIDEMVEARCSSVLPNNIQRKLR